MTAWYNEIDAYCCAWLSNLMDAGLITPGKIDDRSIEEISPADVAGFDRVHWFAGLGGWDFALNLANWGRRVWTGSCPCQPFSVAGRRQGFDDKRHLWPAWHRLIAECRPSVIFGEQTADAPQWLGLVHGDMEAMDYAMACVPIEAASAGAYHFRDRYWFVADRDFARVRQIAPAREQSEPQPDSEYGSGALAASDSDSERSQIQIGESSDIGAQRTALARNGVRDVADLKSLGWGEGWTESELRRWGPAAAVSSIGDCQIIECPDGKWRRLPPPRVRWLGTRLPARIPRVRAFGNAIDPRPAAAFVTAYMDTIGCGGDLRAD